MSDDLLERVRARARDNAFWRYLGVEVAEASDASTRTGAAGVAPDAESVTVIEDETATGDGPGVDG